MGADSHCPMSFSDPRKEQGRGSCEMVLRLHISTWFACVELRPVRKAQAQAAEPGTSVVVSIVTTGLDVVFVYCIRADDTTSLSAPGPQKPATLGQDRDDSCLLAARTFDMREDTLSLKSKLVTVNPGAKELR